jgi:uncharacterized membrane protein
MPKPRKSKTKSSFPTNTPLPSRNTNPPTVTQLSVSRSGPLPPPSELEGYERILPGAAERILALVESQSNHRHMMENKALSIESRNSLLGIIMGGFIGIFGLAVAGMCIYAGHDNAGMTLGGATLVSLVVPFIYGTRERRIEREQKYLVERDYHKRQR